MEAEDIDSEAINVDNKDMIEHETNDKEMSEIMTEAVHSDSGLIAEEFHSEAININKSDMSENVVEENHSHAENVAEQNHNHVEIVAVQNRNHAEIVAEQNHNYAEIVAEENHSHSEFMAEDIHSSNTKSSEIMDEVSQLETNSNLPIISGKLNHSTKMPHLWGWDRGDVLSTKSSQQ